MQDAVKQSYLFRVDFLIGVPDRSFPPPTCAAVLVADDAEKAIVKAKQMCGVKEDADILYIQPRIIGITHNGVLQD